MAEFKTTVYVADGNVEVEDLLFSEYLFEGTEYLQAAVCKS